MQDFVPVLDTDPSNPFKTGSRVMVRGGNAVRAGKLGTVVAWGRSAEADKRFRRTGDPEILIDNEGPVVRYDDGETDWWPGQSMGALVPEKPQLGMNAQAVINGIVQVCNQVDDSGGLGLPVLAYHWAGDTEQVFKVTEIRYGEDLAGGVDLVLSRISE